MASTSHSLYPEVQEACERYPDQSGPFFHAYRDLKLSQRWHDVKPIEVPELRLFVLEGRAKSSVRSSLRSFSRTQDPPRIVWPMALDQSTDTTHLSSIFTAMKPAPEAVTLGIVSTDSSIVYYVLSCVRTCTLLTLQARIEATA